MKTRRFSILHLILTAVAAAALAAGVSAALLRQPMDDAQRSLLKGLELVRTKFVAEYDETQVVDGALTGMVDALGDRWSSYLTAEAYEAQQQRRKNEYVGVGITVSFEDERGLVILAVTGGGPAEEAGLLVGELVTAVDGVSITGEARFEGADRIGGEEGSTVKLTLMSPDGSTREVECERRVIPERPVESELREDGVGYVRLKNFYDNSADALKSAVDDLVERGASALVFDLRNNGGGYLHELTPMLDHLLPEGPIFRTKNAAGEEKVTQSDAHCVEVPMAVLVNENTYSAAEFFAAELREQGAAVIVGEPTSGKGYSQQSMGLPNGGAMNISTGAYFTGEGVSLIGTGVTLDAEVYLDEGGEDNQLTAALAMLNEKMGEN